MFTAQLVEINHVAPIGDDFTQTESFDSIAIFRDGEEIDCIRIPSSEDPEPYDAAVKKVIGGADFTWLSDCF